MRATSYLALDLGAESGRAILGRLEGARLEIEELHRFPNQPRERAGQRWDLPQLFQEIKTGLRRAGERGGPLVSVGLDTWGVDFGLLDQAGELVEPPFCYRDHRTDGAPEQFFRLLPRERVYELTGIQVMQINTLYQLYAMVRDRAPALARAKTLLLMPDLFTYLLTGGKQAEFTIATTSQLYNPQAGGWEPELLEALGIAPDLLPPLVGPGNTVGPLLPAVAQEVGTQPPVVAVGSHDTASAVAAVPAQGRDWAYLSSGTWSLMGIVSPKPLISARTQALNLTNEGGVGGTFRVLKNIMGLWLLQQCRREWGADYAELVAAAAAEPPFQTLFYPDAPGLLNPPSMPAALSDLCRRSGEKTPDSPAAWTRAILESLALRYRMVLEELRQVSEEPINRLHIIGGGARNELLCQFAADATGLPVIAGPVEATAVGNLLTQAWASGALNSLAEIPDTVASSFPLARYQPRGEGGWERAYARFLALAQFSGRGE